MRKLEYNNQSRVSRIQKTENRVIEQNITNRMVETGFREPDSEDKIVDTEIKV